VSIGSAHGTSVDFFGGGNQHVGADVFGEVVEVVAGSRYGTDGGRDSGG
jgi:hypothetical protein